VIDTPRTWRAGSREDTQDFLESFHRIASLEHQRDDAKRALETGRKLEHASDHLLRVAISLRDQILGQVEAGS